VSLRDQSRPCYIVICCLGEGDDGAARQGMTFAVLLINLLMYIAILIPLSVNHISKPDIRAGQGQFLNTSASEVQSSLALTGHPYMECLLLIYLQCTSQFFVSSGICRG
jgi:hypothetical protein